MLESYCICEKGNIKSTNQDRAGQFRNGDRGLFFVADGMGGHYDGEKASSTVLANLTKWWNRRSAEGFPDLHQSITQLRQILETSHRQIGLLAPQGQICGTTVVLLLIYERDYALFSIGDSRGYMLRGRMFRPPELIQLTHDDVVGPNGPGGQVNAGKLLRALGPGPECLLTLQTGHVPSHAVFALCTDGIHKYCPNKALAGALADAKHGMPLSTVCENIVSIAKDNFTQDNYSLVLIRC